MYLIQCQYIQSCPVTNALFVFTFQPYKEMLVPYGNVIFDFLSVNVFHTLIVVLPEEPGEIKVVYLYEVYI